jgi:nitrate reductase gamma subunit
MSGSVVFIFYGSILFFIIASLIRIRWYASAPVHLRWEIYRGSSVYEQVDWLTKPKVGFGEKVVSAAKDILFLREYYRRNRGFWYFLYSFHLGVYLLVLWHVWLFATALTTAVEDAPAWGFVWGHVASALIVIGCIGILVKRLTDADMKVNYSRIHYFKWIFILLTLGGGFYAVQVYFGDMPHVLEYVKSQLAFNWEHKLNPSVVTSIHVLSVVPWLIYLPLGHVMQIFFRYYHEIRWDHVPNLRGSALEKRIMSQLERRVSWADYHIQTGKKWSEVAAGMPEVKLESKVGADGKEKNNA